MIYILVLVFLFGLLFGSFLNVCIYRLPRIHATLTGKSFDQLRRGNDSPKRPTGQWTKKGVQPLLQLLHFFGIHLKAVELPVPDDVLDRLEELKDRDYPTINDFAAALENALGKQAAEQYGDSIYQETELKKESIVFPGSHCPHCQTALTPWENIPVLSFLVLGGKCRTCETKISWRYPLVEFLTALLFTACVFRFGILPATFLYLAFIAALVAVSFIDLDHRIIPNSITLPGILVGLLAFRWLPLPWHESLLGAAVGGGTILITGYIGSLVFKKEAMGGGDVKLMAMIGVFLGWKLVLLTIFSGSVIGAAIGIIVKLTTKDDYIPFGPFLSLGALFSLFFGQQFLHWYWTQIFPPM